MFTFDLWTWDTEHFTFDDDVNHTFDGWHNCNGGSSVPYGISYTPELRRDDEILMRFVREYVKH